MTAEDLNLDGMSMDELWSLWQQTHSVRPIQFARTLFPAKPKGYVRATKSLGNYACNKSVAMRLRLKGNISAAIRYENICDSIYSRLPEYAKW